ncbi:MAG TPA: response regulator [Xanthobacteraceae bacterium]|nr:response regulator [Xanthobacteraceae bacterium]HUN99144.1 response regulator [Bradyrhizobium sp.]
MTTSGGAVVINVDDQDAQRYVKSRDLRLAGFVVIEARNGAEALRLVDQHRPPVVLLDVQLPDINGFEVCRFIKQKWPQVMVLMTSATFTSPTDRSLGLDAGADSYLVQPSEPIELAAGINALLRLYRSEEELRRINTSLEARVHARIADLAEANANLSAEIEQRQKAEVALIQAQKMEAIGQLTGGLAHDFNNLLTAIVGNLDLIRVRSGDARIRRLADSAFRAAERGSKLTAQLLAFSRIQKIATAPIDVNALIVGMNELVSQSIGTNIVIKTTLDPALPTAMGDINQLELAILNLSINARDAMPNGGTLTISTGLILDNPNFVAIAVADTGSGMSSEVKARAFDPFFTTKPTGKGTGLGLSQVYGIVQQTGGAVTLDSELGKGTTVTLLLPRAADDAVAARQSESEVPRSQSSEKILIIDDDPDVREFASIFLSEIGYAVQEVEHGAAALAILDEFDPDLLVLDFAMPGINGADTAAAARQRNAALRILFVTGFADSAALAAAVGGAPLLRKPFRPSELATAVRLALDTPATSSEASAISRMSE